MTSPVPQVSHAEGALLGAAMCGAPDLDDLLALVESDDFYQPWHGEVLVGNGWVHRAGNQPDTISVR